MYVLLAAVALLAAIGSAKGVERQAEPQSQERPRPDSSEPFVIQGRITGIQGTLVMVKTPDSYPGGTGTHALFVIAGISFKVDISHARVLLPDGKQADKQPLTIGDRVLMVLSGPNSASTSVSPLSLNQTYFASTIERIAPGDKATTH
jgi:hypothetical protein